MNLKIANILSKVIEGGIIILLFLTPLFFLTQTSESFSFPKQVLLTFGLGILIIIWGIKMVLEKKVLILRNPLILPIIIFLGVFLASTFFSIHRFSSILGPYPSFYGGLFTLVIFILGFFLITSNIKTKSQISRLIFALCLSGVILATIGILHFFNVFPAKKIIADSFITPAGSVDTTSIFLALLLPFLLFPLFFKKGIILQILSALAATFLLFYIFLIGNLAALLSVFLVVIAALLFSFFSKEKKEIFKISFVLFFCFVLLAVNNFGPIRKNVPFLKDKVVLHEISLVKPWAAWLIAADGFRDPKALALGSGPGTYLADFTRFKPVMFNYQPFWGLRADRSFNEYFNLLSTIGLLGFAAFLYLLLKAFGISKEFLKRANKKEEITGISILFSVLLFVFICFFSVPTALISFTFWVLLGLTMSYFSAVGLAGIKEVELSLAAIQAKEEKRDHKREIFPFLALIFILVISGVLMSQTSKMLRAEMKFTKGFSERNKPEVSSNAIMQPITEAAAIMPQNDAYRRVISSFSLDLFLIAEQRQQLSADERKNLAFTAVEQGRMAAGLAPQNILNWENLQRVYSLISVEGNDSQLIDVVFPAESRLDPLNPRHANDLGLVFFNMRNDVESAKTNFKIATSLKPDYIDAHYNLARVFRADGGRENAIKEYDTTLGLLASQLSLGDRNTLGVSLEQLKQLEAQIRAERELVAQEIEKAKQAAEEQKKAEEEKKPE